MDKNGSKNLVRNIGAKVPIEAVKQRFIRPFLKSEMTISYANGIERYSGLFELGRAYNVIQGAKTYNLPDGTKLGWKKNWLHDEKVWEEMIIPVLDPVIRDSFTFGSKKTAEVLKEIDLGDDK